MKQFFFAVICGSLVFAGCNPGSSNDKTQAKDSSVKTVTTPGTNPTQVVTPVSTTPTTAAAGMNPEHGKPGHRCDIPVGAPLNTPATNPTVVSPNTTPQAPTINTSPVVQPANNSNTSTVAPGMNPQHGQPGHRCDIPVGSPLNSKPATPTITTSPVKNN